jgi:hypothetical protein
LIIVATGENADSSIPAKNADIMDITCMEYAFPANKQRKRRARKEGRSKGKERLKIS